MEICESQISDGQEYNKTNMRKIQVEGSNPKSIPKNHALYRIFDVFQFIFNSLIRNYFFIKFAKNQVWIVVHETNYFLNTFPK